MKICLKIHKNTINKKQINLIKKFCSLLMSKMKLSKDLTIEFLGERHGKMTTGSFLPKKNLIKILSRERRNFSIHFLMTILQALSSKLRWAGSKIGN